MDSAIGIASVIIIAMVVGNGAGFNARRDVSTIDVKTRFAFAFLALPFFMTSLTAVNGETTTALHNPTQIRYAMPSVAPAATTADLLGDHFNNNNNRDPYENVGRLDNDATRSTVYMGTRPKPIDFDLNDTEGLSYAKTREFERRCRSNHDLVETYGFVSDLKAKYCRMNCKYVPRGYSEPFDCRTYSSLPSFNGGPGLWENENIREIKRRRAAKEVPQAKEALTGGPMEEFNSKQAHARKDVIKDSFVMFYKSYSHYVIQLIALIIIVGSNGTYNNRDGKGYTAVQTRAMVAFIGAVLILLTCQKEWYVKFSLIIVLAYAATLTAQLSSTHGQLVLGVMTVVTMFMFAPAVAMTEYNTFLIIVIMLMIIYVFGTVYTSRTPGDFILYGYVFFLINFLRDTSSYLIMLDSENKWLSIALALGSAPLPLGENTSGWSNIIKIINDITDYLTHMYPDIDVASIWYLVAIVCFILPFALRLGIIRMRRKYRVYDFEMVVSDLAVYSMDLGKPLVRIVRYATNGKVPTVKERTSFVSDVCLLVLTYVEYTRACEVFYFRLVATVLGVIYVGNNNLFLVGSVDDDEEDWDGEYDYETESEKLSIFLTEIKTAKRHPGAFPQNDSAPWSDATVVSDLLNGVVQVVSGDETTRTSGIGILRKMPDETVALYTAKHVISSGNQFKLEGSSHHVTANNTKTLGRGSDPATGVILARGKHVSVPVGFEVASVSDYAAGFKHLTVLTTNNMQCPVSKFKLDALNHTGQIKANLRRGDSGAPVFGYLSNGGVRYIGAVSSGNPDMDAGNRISLAIESMVIPSFKQRKRNNTNENAVRKKPSTVPDPGKSDNKKLVDKNTDDAKPGLVDNILKENEDDLTSYKLNSSGYEAFETEDEKLAERTRRIEGFRSSLEAAFAAANLSNNAKQDAVARFNAIRV